MFRVHEADTRYWILDPPTPPLTSRQENGQVLVKSCQSSSGLWRLWEGAQQLSINPQAEWPNRRCGVEFAQGYFGGCWRDSRVL